MKPNLTIVLLKRIRLKRLEMTGEEAVYKYEPSLFPFLLNWDETREVEVAGQDLTSFTAEISPNR
jgi:hypothetical protein